MTNSRGIWRRRRQAVSGGEGGKQYLEVQGARWLSGGAGGKQWASGGAGGNCRYLEVQEASSGYHEVHKANSGCLEVHKAKSGYLHGGTGGKQWIPGGAEGKQWVSGGAQGREWVSGGTGGRLLAQDSEKNLCDDPSRPFLVPFLVPVFLLSQVPVWAWPASGEVSTLDLTVTMNMTTAVGGRPHHAHSHQRDK